MIEFTVIDKLTGKYPDFRPIALNEAWAKNLIYSGFDGFFIGEDGCLILVDECGNSAYCPADRFEVRFNRPKPEALTLEKLRKIKMCEPLYVELLPPCHSERWEIPMNIVHGMERLICKGTEVYFLDDYGKTWLAYASKPEPEEG